MKNTNTQFTKPDTKIALKHKKRCSNSLIGKGKFLKIEIPFLSSIRLVKIKMYVTLYSVGKTVYIYTLLVGSKVTQHFGRRIWQYLTKLHMYLPLKTALLRYNSHITQFTNFKHII